MFLLPVSPGMFVLFLCGVWIVFFFWGRFGPTRHGRVKGIQRRFCLPCQSLACPVDNMPEPCQCSLRNVALRLCTRISGTIRRRSQQSRLLHDAWTWWRDIGCIYWSRGWCDVMWCYWRNCCDSTLIDNTLSVYRLHYSTHTTASQAFDHYWLEHYEILKEMI